VPAHLGPATNTRPGCTATAFQIMPSLRAATRNPSDPAGAPDGATEPGAEPGGEAGGGPGWAAQATAAQPSSAATTTLNVLLRSIALPLTLSHLARPDTVGRGN